MRADEAIIESDLVKLGPTYRDGPMKIVVNRRGLGRLSPPLDGFGLVKKHALRLRRIVHHAEFQRMTNGFGRMLLNERFDDSGTEPLDDEPT